MYTVSLEIINKCNLNCAYCYLGEKKNVYMDFEIAKRAVEIAIRETQKQYDKTLVVYLIGGEPLMAFGLIKDIVKYVVRRCQECGLKYIFSMTTNGVLITNEIISFLITYKFELKLSLDGAEEVHNLNRKDYAGIGSFRKIMENLKYIHKYEETTNLKVTIAHVVTKNNFKFFAESYQFLLNMGCRKIETGIDHYCQWSTKEIKELKDQFNKVFHLYMDYMKKDEKKISWNMFEQYLRSYLFPCAPYACGAGLNSIFVATDGCIYTCIELSEFLIGNVEYGLDVGRIREIAYTNNIKDAMCEECKYIVHCKSRSCFASNYEVNGDIHKPVEIKCVVTQKMYELIEENIGKNQLEKMKKAY